MMYKKKKALNGRAILWVAVCLSSMLSVMIFVPGMLVKKFPNSQAPADSVAAPLGSAKEQGPMVPVYLSKQDTVETVPLEQYVKGVLAAEMPAEFELEALKAQAMAARTYIVRRATENDFSNVPVSEAWVTDTTAHQVYLSDQELKEKWGPGVYETNMAKIARAVNETKDQILIYDHKPIDATFFSTSNGYTENSEDYWPDKIPYLRSVPSPWDVSLSPRYKETVSLDYKTLLQKLGVSSISTSSGRSTGMKVLAWSAGKRIKTMTIGGKTFTGREVREKLGLASSQFDWKWKGTKLEITTYGYGHGVGLSQWGANGMAMEGKTAKDIVTYYYTGISIGLASSYLKPS